MIMLRNNFKPIYKTHFVKFQKKNFWLQFLKMANANLDKNKTQDELTRIAIVNDDRCKPKKCSQECKKNCPVVRIGKLCIEVNSDSKIAFLSEPCKGMANKLW